MKIIRGYKTRLSPNKRQAELLLRYAGTARFVYNWALADRIEKYKAGTPTTRYAQIKHFNSIKRDLYPWITEMPYVVTQEAFAHLDAAYKNFFRRVKKGEEPGFPKFKSKHRGITSFSFRGSIRVEKTRIKLPIIGWIKLGQAGYLPESDVKILKATVSSRAGYWFVSMQVEQEIDEPKPATAPAIGIDVGLKSLAVCSNGKVFDNPKTLYMHEKKLARMQRELSRRKKGGKNWEKTRAKIARLHYKIASIRSTTLHEVSCYVTAKARPRAVVMEDLNVSGMLKNGHLSKAIQDASFGELRRQIEYKASWNGIEFILAGRWFPSSKTCSRCGSRKDVLKLSERIYRCAACGVIIDRDYNAAQNLASLAFSQSEPANGGGLPGELSRTEAAL